MLFLLCDEDMRSPSSFWKGIVLSCYANCEVCESPSIQPTSRQGACGDHFIQSELLRQVQREIQSKWVSATRRASGTWRKQCPPPLRMRAKTPVPHEEGVGQAMGEAGFSWSYYSFPGSSSGMSLTLETF